MRNEDVEANNRLKEQFLCCLPDILRYAGHVFRRCRPDDRDEFVSETVARMWLFFARLSARGKDPQKLFRPLLRFCVLAVKDDRRVGGRRNARDLCHRARRDGLRILSLESKHDGSGSPWKEILAETKAFSPAEAAAARLDIAAWLRSETSRKRAVANALAVGERPSTIASRFHVSCARISQIRDELRASWERFQAGDEPARLRAAAAICP
jgi:hypothetical protein